MAEANIRINPDNTVTATLSDGKSYVLREPRAKDMDGLSQDLIKIKHTDQVQKLLAKISTPPVTRAVYGKSHPQLCLFAHRHDAPAGQ